MFDVYVIVNVYKFHNVFIFVILLPPILISLCFFVLFFRLGNIHDPDLGPPPPVMKTFKEFLLSLDDSVDETESVKRYNEYKVEFRRQQMQDFFLAHKDEEWYGRSCHLAPFHLLHVVWRLAL